MTDETMPKENGIKLDWNHLYILGWYGPDGKGYMTTWDGDAPIVTIIVTGPKVQIHGPPIWDSPEVLGRDSGFGLTYDKYAIQEEIL